MDFISSLFSDVKQKYQHSADACQQAQGLTQHSTHNTDERWIFFEFRPSKPSYFGHVLCSFVLIASAEMLSLSIPQEGDSTFGMPLRYGPPGQKANLGKLLSWPTHSAEVEQTSRCDATCDGGEGQLGHQGHMVLERDSFAK